MKDAPAEPAAAFAQRHSSLKDRLKELADAYDALHFDEVAADEPWITEPIAVLLAATVDALERNERLALLGWASGPRKYLQSRFPNNLQLWQRDRAGSLVDLVDMLEKELSRVEPHVPSAKHKSTTVANKLLGPGLDPLGFVAQRSPEDAAAQAVNLVVSDLFGEPQKHLFIRREIRAKGVPVTPTKTKPDAPGTPRPDGLDDAAALALVGMWVPPAAIDAVVGHIVSKHSEPRDLAIKVVGAVLEAYGYKSADLSAVYKKSARQRGQSPRLAPTKPSAKS